MSQSPTTFVSANVRAEMARRRITQQQVAEALGLKQGSVSKRLNGRVPWDVNEVSTVADLLGVPVSALIGEPERAA